MQNDRNRYDRREPKRNGTRELGRTSIGRDELQAGGGKLDQEPRRPDIPEMVLAMVMETNATMANARATTITANPLFRQWTERQVSFQRLALYFHQDTRSRGKTSVSRRGQLSRGRHIFPVMVLPSAVSKEVPKQAEPGHNSINEGMLRQPTPCSGGSIHPRCAPSRTAPRHSSSHVAASC